jgi:predicted acyltransferase
MNAPTSPPRDIPPRLISLDALRGFDMAFIVGLGGVIAALAQALGLPALKAQFDHVPWEGFHFEDLIFPLFVFISGVSLTFSLPRSVERHGRGKAALILARRCLVLFLLGVFFNSGLSKGIENVRWMGVLQRIALATLGAGLFSLWLRSRGLAIATALVLTGYWALLTFVGGSEWREGLNVVNQFDARWLPGRKYDGTHDPEGLLSTFPAIGTALLGVLAGRWLAGAATMPRKAMGLAVAGVIALGLGWAWSWQMPVIKKLWTSSFVLVAAGWSALLLALFYWLVEIRGWKAWTTPWVWIGSNSITIYLAVNVARPLALAERITGPRPGTPEWVVHAVAFALVLWLARLLYKRGVFIRV